MWWPIEEVFYSVNAKSALKLGQVRGVALLAAATQGLPVAEYAPLKISRAWWATAWRRRNRCKFMVARLLELAEIPEPPDAADAWAIAICHIHTAQTLLQQGAGAMRGWLLAAALVAAVLPMWGEPDASLRVRVFRIPD